jgi:hypothetical protein
VRTRIGVLAAVLAALLVTAPVAANAETASATCKIGIVLPSRLALTSASTPYGVRLTGQTSCFTYAPWDLSEGLISTGQVLQFWAPNTSGFFTYFGGPASVHALPRQGGYSLVTTTDPVTGVSETYTLVQSGSNTMRVKYDSRIGWRSAKHIGRQLRLRAAVASVSDATRYSGSYAAWTGAKIRFQYEHAGVWKTIAVGHADTGGVARVVVPFKKGQWRAVSADSSTTWGRSTSSHKL